MTQNDAVVNLAPQVRRSRSSATLMNPACSPETSAGRPLMKPTERRGCVSAADKILVNPGSVGQPRDGDSRAAFLAIWDDTESLLEFHRAEYSVATTQPASRCPASRLSDHSSDAWPLVTFCKCDFPGPALLIRSFRSHADLNNFQFSGWRMASRGMLTGYDQIPSPFSDSVVCVCSMVACTQNSGSSSGGAQTRDRRTENPPVCPGPSARRQHQVIRVKAGGVGDCQSRSYRCRDEYQTPG